MSPQVIFMVIHTSAKLTLTVGTSWHLECAYVLYPCGPYKMKGLTVVFCWADTPAGKVRVDASIRVTNGGGGAVIVCKVDIFDCQLLGSWRGSLCYTVHFPPCCVANSPISNWNSSLVLSTPFHVHPQNRDYLSMAWLTIISQTF